MYRSRVAPDKLIQECKRINKSSCRIVTVKTAIDCLIDHYNKPSETSGQFKSAGWSNWIKITLPSMISSRSNTGNYPAPWWKEGKRKKVRRREKSITYEYAAWLIDWRQSKSNHSDLPHTLRGLTFRILQIDLWDLKKNQNSTGKIEKRKAIQKTKNTCKPKSEERLRIRSSNAAVPCKAEQTAKSEGSG